MDSSLLPSSVNHQHQDRRFSSHFSDDGDLTALSYDDWEIIFMEQKPAGTFRVWME